MKFILLFVSIFSFLFSDVKEDIYSLYQMKQYEKACKLGLQNLSKNSDDESFVSMYAFSCLYADHIECK